MVKYTFDPCFQEEAEAGGLELEDSLVYIGVPGQPELLSYIVLGGLRKNQVASRNKICLDSSKASSIKLDMIFSRKW